MTVAGGGRRRRRHLCRAAAHHEDGHILVLGVEERVSALRYSRLQVCGLLLNLRARRAAAAAAGVSGGGGGGGAAAASRGQPAPRARCRSSPDAVPGNRVRRRHGRAPREGSRRRHGPNPRRSAARVPPTRAPPRTSASPCCASSSRYSRPVSERTPAPPRTRIVDTRCQSHSAKKMPTRALRGIAQVTRAGLKMVSAILWGWGRSTVPRFMSRMPRQTCEAVRAAGAAMGLANTGCSARASACPCAAPRPCPALSGAHTAQESGRRPRAPALTPGFPAAPRRRPAPAPPIIPRPRFRRSPHPGAACPEPPQGQCANSSLQRLAVCSCSSAAA